MRVYIVLALCLTHAVFAQAQTQALLADVNRDGTVNILDVQGGINQALGLASQTTEADVDGNAAVNVLDVQNLINSALGTGGVFQVVSGTLVAGGAKDLAQQLRIEAVSDEGLISEAALQSDGQFRLSLRTGMGWSLAVVNAQNAIQGWLTFPLAGYTSTTLPLPDLSNGEVMSLGQTPLGMGQPVTVNALGLISDVSTPITATDANNDGVADFVQPLFQTVLNALESLSAFLSGQNDAAADLLNRIAACVNSNMEQLSRPSLLDSNSDGVPDFAAPFLDCLGTAFTEWFAQFDWSGTPVQQWLSDEDGNGQPWIVDSEINYLISELPGWIEGLNRLETADANGNGIPDFLEGHAVIPGVMNDDRCPAISQDSNHNGIPDFLESDLHTAGDNDNDGIPDAQDLDNDNDGIPDYADSTPTTPGP